MTTETAPYGEWRSPIDGADVARKQVSLAFPVVDAAGVWWQESRPEEGGRVAVVRQGPDGVKHDLLPMPWNARTRVHEYGGKSYLPLPDGFVFEFEERWNSEGQQWYAREMMRIEVAEGTIAEVTVYCTGDWDQARQAEHAAAVTLIRP